MKLIWKAALAGAVLAVLVVAAVVASWWFLIRDNAELATQAPEIPTGLARTTTTPPAEGGTPGVGDVLTYRVIPEQSEAAYFADEKLARLPLPSTAKGTTNEIDGQFFLTPDGTALAPGRTSEFTVDLRNLKSDEGGRDSRVQSALETDTFPTATFTLSSATGYDPAIPEGEEQTLQFTGTLDLHGVQREVTWDVKARRAEGVITGLATLTIRYEDYGIERPNIANFVTVNEDVTLQVQIVAQRT
jgi:polyisoprenoid-binding protein YceI